MAKTCFYCKKGSELQDLMIEIQPLKTSTLYLNKDQTYKGRCILALNTHKRELFELTEKERELFIEDISTSAHILQKIFLPEKINYAIYGDIVSHLHVHLVPKREGDEHWGEAFINNPKEKHLLKNKEYEDLVNQIQYFLTNQEEL